jgi:hypothetical protein
MRLIAAGLFVAAGFFGVAVFLDQNHISMHRGQAGRLVLSVALAVLAGFGWWFFNSNDVGT